MAQAWKGDQPKRLSKKVWNCASLGQLTLPTDLRATVRVPREMLSGTSSATSLHLDTNRLFTSRNDSRAPTATVHHNQALHAWHDRVDSHPVLFFLLFAQCLQHELNFRFVWYCYCCHLLVLVVPVGCWNSHVGFFFFCFSLNGIQQLLWLAFSFRVWGFNLSFAWHGMFHIVEP